MPVEDSDDVAVERAVLAADEAVVILEEADVLDAQLDLPELSLDLIDDRVLEQPRDEVAQVLAERGSRRFGE